MSTHLVTGFLIKQLHDRLEKQANNLLRSKELTMMQMAVLMALQDAEEKQLSMKELERYFQIAQSTVAGIISRLEQKGLIVAISDATDKRIKVVHITAAGETCCEEAAVHMHEVEEGLLRGFSQEDRDMLNSLLVRAVENLK